MEPVQLVKVQEQGEEEVVLVKARDEEVQVFAHALNVAILLLTQEVSPALR